MNNQLNYMKKSELLSIISKMKKQELVEIINNKIGGSNEHVIKETKNAVRKELVFNKNKESNDKEKNNVNVMANDPKYNKIYEKNNSA
jgi:DNA replication protein DnaD